MNATTRRQRNHPAHPVHLARQRRSAARAALASWAGILALSAASCALLLGCGGAEDMMALPAAVPPALAEAGAAAIHPEGCVVVAGR